MQGIYRAMPFSKIKPRKSIFLTHFLFFAKKPKNHPPIEQFGFYILPNKKELWGLPLVNYP